MEEDTSLVWRKSKIIMQEGHSLVWRNAFYQDSLNINDLSGHFINMEEPKVITIGDVMD